MTGYVGGYWFVARDGRWFVTRREDAMVEDGASGQVGQIAPLDLGDGHSAVTVGFGDCHQGACTDGVDVVELSGDKSTEVLRVMLGSHATGFDGRCGNILTGGRAASPLSPDDDCVDISGQWRLEPNAAASRPDVVVHFTGHELARDPAGHDATAKSVDETAVFRYKAGKYELVSGRNPTHDF